MDPFNWWSLAIIRNYLHSWYMWSLVSISHRRYFLHSVISPIPSESYHFFSHLLLLPLLTKRPRLLLHSTQTRPDQAGHNAKSFNYQLKSKTTAEERVSLRGTLPSTTARKRTLDKVRVAVARVDWLPTNNCALIWKAVTRAGEIFKRQHVSDSCLFNHSDLTSAGYGQSLGSISD